MHPHSPTGPTCRWLTFGTLLATTVLAGCMLFPAAERPLPENRCPDAARCLELGALLAAGESQQARDDIGSAASTEQEDRPANERELIAAIAEVHSGNEAAARASLEHLKVAIDSQCVAAREVVKLYLAYLDRAILRARLLEANDTIKALADVEKALLESESASNRVEER